MKILGKIVLFILLTNYVAYAKVIKDSDFILTLNTVEKEVYVGESFEVILLFKEKKSFEAVDSEFISPKFQGSWLKNETKPQKKEAKIYATTKIVYTIAAQRVGALKVFPAQIRIASRVETTSSSGFLKREIKWKTYSSNELNINVKALPSGVDLVGEFSIKASVENLEVNAKEALHLKVEVLSKGNLEDITSFKPYINDVNTLDGEILIDGDVLSQKILFVAENDFIIAPFILKYFDPTTKQIKIIATKQISIKVRNAKVKKDLVIKQEQEIFISNEKIQDEFHTLRMIGIYIFGLISGILLIVYKPWKFLGKEKSISLKEPKTLLIKLLPYMNDDEVENMIEMMEQNIYVDPQAKIDKKSLKKLIQKYEIS